MMTQNKHPQKSVIFLTVLVLTILSCQGIGGFNPFATTTPSPTATFTPSPTFTPSQTPTRTQTPSPVPLPTGVTTEEQSDGSTLFVDYDNQYQLNIPKTWFLIPLSSDDITDIR